MFAFYLKISDVIYSWFIFFYGDIFREYNKSKYLAFVCMKMQGQLLQGKHMHVLAEIENSGQCGEKQVENAKSYAKSNEILEVGLIMENYFSLSQASERIIFAKTFNF